MAIAKHILDTAATYGIDKKDIVFDTLTMTVSADPNAAMVTLEALRRIRTELGCHTSLGVSNVSFGLPCRDVLNSAFFLMALESGLSAAIMNPHSADMMKVYYAHRALTNKDVNCADYIAAAASFPTTEVGATAVATAKEEYASTLQRAICKGLAGEAAALTAQLLATTAPLTVVNEEIIPALNQVGEGFEKKTVYLPQLLMAAEAAGAAFEQVKAVMAQGEPAPKKGTFVLATVEGDIHDIGKNIVKLLMENYGYEVIDLGRDVPPDTVVEAVRTHHAKLVGLSALMTTTVPAMEATIRLLREHCPDCKIVVGGAVLTAEYAAKIGADHYAPDAMAAVRYAEEIMG